MHKYVLRSCPDEVTLLCLACLNRRLVASCGRRQDRAHCLLDQLMFALFEDPQGCLHQHCMSEMFSYKYIGEKWFNEFKNLSIYLRNILT
jgi:hypothetical protein